jgi:hypothetical protein
MTSLEHESNDTSVSASDYGAENWDQENWGDMDVSRSIKIYAESFAHEFFMALDIARPIVATWWTAINSQC